MKVEILSYKGAVTDPTPVAQREPWVCICLTRIPCFFNGAFSGWHDTLLTYGSTQIDAERTLLHAVKKLLPEEYYSVHEVDL